MSDETATPQKPKPIDGRRLIAVASGKGGVGKTWFAITLSHALAHAGKKVLLFDGDLGLANVDIQLGLMPKHDVGEVIDGKITIKNAVHHYSEGGFDVLAGRSGSGSIATLPPPRILRLRQSVAEVAQNYDKVVMDLGAGVDRLVQLFAGPAEHCLLVVNEEPTSLTDAYAFIKLANKAHAAGNIRIVVNAAESQARGKKTYETLAKACQSFLHTEPPLAGVIRRDNRVREAIRAQTPLMIRSPASEAGTDVENIVSTLFAGTGG